MSVWSLDLRAHARDLHDVLKKILHVAVGLTSTTIASTITAIGVTAVSVVRGLLSYVADHTADAVQECSKRIPQIRSRTLLALILVDIWVAAVRRATTSTGSGIRRVSHDIILNFDLYVLWLWR